MTSPVVEINSLVGEMTPTVGKINSTSVTRRNRFLVVIKQPVPPLKKVQARAVALAVTVLSRNGPYLDAFYSNVNFWCPQRSSKRYLG